jgi:hypothetical protein
MKTKITTTVLLLVIVLFSSFTADDNGQIYFMRSTNSIGSAVAYKVYIDGKVVCHLKNQRYSMHTVPAGEHTVTIQNSGLGSKQISLPLTINVQPGKSNYMVVINGKTLYMQEAVQSSAEGLLKRLAATDQCLPK